MMGGLRLLISGEMSLQGDTSLDEAVLEPPGDWIGCEARQSSVGIISDRPVAEEDLTIDLKMGVDVPIAAACLACMEASAGIDDVTRGLGVLGWTETFGVTGRLRGPASSWNGFGGLAPADLISKESLDGSSATMENLGRAPSRLWRRRRR